MSKRVADKEINHDNWADEEEAEDAGTFRQASEDEIKKRIIKTARRRANTDEPATKPVFSGFTFAKSNASEEKSITNSFTGILGASKSLLGKEETKFRNTSESSAKMSEVGQNNNEFYTEITALNESVSKWIKKHVDADPLCILSPIFKGYEAYLKDILAKRRKKMEEKDNSMASDKAILKNTPSPSSSVQQNLFKARSETVNSALNIFSAKPTEKTEEPRKNLFDAVSRRLSFGSSSTSGQSSVSAADFSSRSVAQCGFTIATPEGEENYEVPEKYNFQPVIEEDSVYTIRCKVFIKKDDTYVDGGVGYLFLKPVPDSDKTQLIVRGDTNVGNLLINILLSESVPTQRMGKNNVMMVCIPTPEKGPTPSSILLRVKTAEQADELMEMIVKYKR